MACILVTLLRLYGARYLQFLYLATEVQDHFYALDLLYESGNLKHYVCVDGLFQLKYSAVSFINQCSALFNLIGIDWPE